MVEGQGRKCLPSDHGSQQNIQMSIAGKSYKIDALLLDINIINLYEVICEKSKRIEMSKIGYASIEQ